MVESGNISLKAVPLSFWTVGARIKSENLFANVANKCSMAGVTTGNVEYLANAIHEVTKSA